MSRTPESPLRRLRVRAQFKKAARGMKVSRRGFVLQAVSVDAPDTGIGYTVTKKTGNAPERSRIKRRLRAAAKACAGTFIPGHDYVLIGRRESLSEPFGSLVSGLETSIERIHGSRARRDSSER
ncbi:ribonuclease P protein component [Pelagibacterium montanilacus]|uniref:ribonuclease P protein component n=1 Tax=Pelagibacterium montanilacus TaxID=2185280 RepID=UPI000F8CFAB6|nr:ribonuclease P protein component [Pelagibacterium montanilacus]